MKQAVFNVGFTALVFYGLVAVLSGCSMLGADPWARGTLARDDMTFPGDPLNALLDDHIYFSKEAASGGSGVSGGGCGCN